MNRRISEILTEAAQNLVDAGRAAVKTLESPVYNLSGEGGDETGADNSTDAYDGVIALTQVDPRPIYVPRGRFLLDVGRGIPSGTKIVGAGMNLTTLVATGDSTSLLENLSVDDFDIEISDLTIEGPGTGTSGRGLYLRGVDGLIIRRVRATNFGEVGIYVNECNDVVIEVCEADNCCKAVGLGAGIWVQSCTKVVASNNSVHNNSYRGLSFYGTTKSVMSNNIAYSNTDAGLNLSGYCSYCTVEGNVSEANGSAATGSNDGINGHGCSHSTFRGNICRGNAFNGIAVDGSGASADQESDNNTYVGNICEANTNGIYLYYSRYGLVEGNQCNGNTGQGIKCVGGSSHSLTNNTAMDNGTALGDIHVASTCPNGQIAGNRVGSKSGGTARQGIRIEATGWRIGDNDTSLTDQTKPYVLTDKLNQTYVHQKTVLSPKIDLSGAPQAFLVFTPKRNGRIISLRYIYTEAASADAGVAMRVGTLTSATRYDNQTSEQSKAVGYVLANNSPGDYARLDANTPVVFATTGGKTGTGEVVLEVTYWEEVWYV